MGAVTIHSGSINIYHNIFFFTVFFDFFGISYLLVFANIHIAGSGICIPTKISDIKLLIIKELNYVRGTIYPALSSNDVKCFSNW